MPSREPSTTPSRNWRSLPLSKCDLILRLDRPDAAYRAGETVRGELLVTVNADCRCNALTLAHEWRTHGRGNRAKLETLKISLYQGEWSPGEEHRYPFEIPLPDGPVTYHGHVLNVDHYIKARADIPWAIDPKTEAELLVTTGDTGRYDFGPEFNPPADKLQASRKHRGLLLIGGGIVAGIGLIVTLICLGLVLTGDDDAWGGMVGAGLVFVIGGAIFLGGLWQGLAQKKLGVPDIRISRSRVAPGERLTIGAKIDPRAEVTIDGVHVELTGREVVVSGSGTNRTTHHHEVHKRSFALLRDPRQLRRGERVEIAAEVEIPPDAPFTFTADDNELEWKLTLTISIPKWPDWKQVYPITVGPAGK